MDVVAKSGFGNSLFFVAAGALFLTNASLGAGGFFGPNDLVFAIFLLIGVAKSFFGDGGSRVADGALFGAFASFGAGGFFGPGDDIFAILAFRVGVTSGLDGLGNFFTTDAALYFLRTSFGAGWGFDVIWLAKGVLSFVNLALVASGAWFPVVVVVAFPGGISGSGVDVLG